MLCSLSAGYLDKTKSIDFKSKVEETDIFRTLTFPETTKWQRWMQAGGDFYAYKKNWNNYEEVVA